MHVYPFKLSWPRKQTGRLTIARTCPNTQCHQLFRDIVTLFYSILEYGAGNSEGRDGTCHQGCVRLRHQASSALLFCAAYLSKPRGVPQTKVLSIVQKVVSIKTFQQPHHDVAKKNEIVEVEAFPLSLGKRPPYCFPKLHVLKPV